MQTVKRRRLSADAWAAMLEKFEASGQSAEVFCQQERVSLASLQRWQAMPGPASSKKPQSPMRRVASAEVAPFVDLGGLEMRGGHLEVRLDFGGGVILQLSRG